MKTKTINIKKDDFTVTITFSVRWDRMDKHDDLLYLWTGVWGFYPFVPVEIELLMSSEKNKKRMKLFIIVEFTHRNVRINDKTAKKEIVERIEKYFKEEVWEEEAQWEDLDFSKKINEYEEDIVSYFLQKGLTELFEPVPYEQLGP